MAEGVVLIISLNEKYAFTCFYAHIPTSKHFEPKQPKSSVAFSTNRLLKQIYYLAT